MERIEASSSWNDPPTTPQIATIMWYARVLRIDITEKDLPANRIEARNMMYCLRADLLKKNASKNATSKKASQGKAV